MKKWSIAVSVIVVALGVGSVSYGQGEQPSLAGKWTYRSFHNNPDQGTPVNDLLFGEGEMTLEPVREGRLKGRVSFGALYQLELNGGVTYGDPVTLRFRGVGDTEGSKGWVYDYVGYLVPVWPQGKEQTTAIVGTVVRSQPHSNGNAPAGVVASFIMVKVPGIAGAVSELSVVTPPGAFSLMPTPRATVTVESAGVDGPRKRMSSISEVPIFGGARALFAPQNFTAEASALSAVSRESAPKTADQIPDFKLAPAALESLLPKAQQIRLAMTSEDLLKLPEVVNAADGRIELRVGYGLNKIGEDLVYLRSYNGNLVGPTIRAKAGETIKVKLINDLPAEPDTPHDPDNPNGHHNWNTTNLHTHGLHVAPERLPGEDGASDNVLLRIKPGQSQNYSIHVPDDHEAGAFWYHAHVHGSTSAQVSSGMAGMLIIERDKDSLDDVKSIAVAKDQTLVLQQVPYVMRNNGKGPGMIEYGDEEFFGPGMWDSMGRYTTVNGQEVPRVILKPGEVQRWRMVHSGVREPLHLQLVRAPMNPDAAGGAKKPAGPEMIQFHEIAVDGLALGKVVAKQVLELEPGYRSEALVKAPNAAGEYLLVDHEPDGGDLEKLKYIARVTVKGAPVKMALPTDQEVSGYRIKSVDDSELTRKGRELYYGIRLNGVFGVPGENIFGVRNNSDPWQTYSNDPGKAFVLNLGDVEELVIGSDNVSGSGAPIAVSHPFHIHVNPFEVVEEWIVDAAGNKIEDVPMDPVWRDTLLLKQNHRYRIRTRIEDFVGTFVHHCHILDHEDNGMMQLVRIEDPNKAVAFVKPDSGTAFAKALGGKPTVALFIKGAVCDHCREQVESFARSQADFKKAGYQLLAVSPDAGKDEQIAGVSHVGDPEHSQFEKLGLKMADSSLLHGTFVIGGDGAVQWRTTGDAPFMNVEAVLANVQAADAPGVEIEVRNTDVGSDDYVTWAPTACRIRLSGAQAGQEAVSVVLTNDPEQPVPEGRKIPLDGNLSFAKTVAPGQTARLSQLALELPADGSWVSFYIAGEFPANATKGRASTADKDAVIEVHENSASGPVIGRHALMVRVRKEINSLTATEKQEFLKAMADVHFVRNRFERFVEYHRLAAEHNEWRDQAHQGPAFISWHRVFLLELEREIQKSFPHVAFPYWIQVKDREFKIFTEDFLGSNISGNREVAFASTNPLHGWYMRLNRPGQNLPMGLLLRNPVDLNQGNRRFPSGDQFLDTPNFKDFAPNVWGFNGNNRIENDGLNLEGNPHNRGHGFVGEWMTNCRTSPADPVFWVFHCYHDYYWAKWQAHFNRFDRTGGTNETSFWPADSYTSNNKVPLGHHLNDSLWPWDGSTDWSKGFDQERNARRPDRNISEPDPTDKFFPFVRAPFSDLWPAADVAPTNADMIDYLGMTPDVLPHGTCYDDLPFGARSQTDVAPELFTANNPEFALELFMNKDTPPELKEKSIPKIDASAAAADPTKLGEIVRGSDTVKVRQTAFELLADQDIPAALKLAEGIVSAEKPEDEFAVGLIEYLSSIMHFDADAPTRMKIMQFLVEAAKAEKSPAIRSVATAKLAAMNNEAAKAPLKEFFLKPEKTTLSQAEVTRLQGGFADQIPSLRKRVDHKDVDVAAAAMLALSSDSESEKTRAAIALNQKKDVSVRIAAVKSLVHGEEQGDEVLTQIFNDPKEPLKLREAAGAGLRVWIQKNGPVKSGGGGPRALATPEVRATSAEDEPVIDSLRMMIQEANETSAAKGESEPENH